MSSLNFFFVIFIVLLQFFWIIHSPFSSSFSCNLWMSFSIFCRFLKPFCSIFVVPIPISFSLFFSIIFLPTGLSFFSFRTPMIVLTLILTLLFRIFVRHMLPQKANVV